MPAAQPLTLSLCVCCMVAVLPCYPAHTGGCHPVCKDVAALQRGKEQGLAAVDTLFSHMFLPGGLSAFGTDTALAGRLLQTAGR